MAIYCLNVHNMNLIVSLWKGLTMQCFGPLCADWLNMTKSTSFGHLLLKCPQHEFNCIFVERSYNAMFWAPVC
jgi:hypothetical protein